MEGLVSAQATASGGGPASLLALYDDALPQVYGYLVHRCGDATVAEDLTSETFMAAVAAVSRHDAPVDVTVAWLIGVARHKLVDHWRAREREERKLALVGGPEDVDDWDERIEVARAQEVLARLGAHHRSALTLRYLDGLPVRDVAAYLGRTVHATEALLVRARAAFRRAYTEGDDASEGGRAP
jgi:RNA polymerase sigma-70 factor (ECF subfamily)